MLVTAAVPFLLALMASASPPSVSKSLGATPVPVSGIHEIGNGPSTVRRNGNNRLFKRDWCDWDIMLLSKSDAEGLRNNLQGSDPWNQVYLPHKSYKYWVWGNAKLCIVNAYVFENTHISRWNAGWAVDYMLQMCCSNLSTWYASTLVGN
jgi:hypothetical protein